MIMTNITYSSYYIEIQYDTLLNNLSQLMYPYPVYEQTPVKYALTKRDKEEKGEKEKVLTA